MRKAAAAAAVAESLAKAESTLKQFEATLMAQGEATNLVDEVEGDNPAGDDVIPPPAGLRKELSKEGQILLQQGLLHPTEGPNVGEDPHGWDGDRSSEDGDDGGGETKSPGGGGGGGGAAGGRAPEPPQPVAPRPPVVPAPPPLPAACADALARFTVAETPDDIIDALEVLQMVVPWTARELLVEAANEKRRAQSSSWTKQVARSFGLCLRAIKARKPKAPERDLYLPPRYYQMHSRNAGSRPADTIPLKFLAKGEAVGKATDFSTKGKNDGKADCLLMKVLLLGYTQSGKSWLLERFVNEEKEPNLFIATIGVDFKHIMARLTADAGPLKLQIWDTAGQERFQAITNAYYRGAQSFVVCFDPHNDAERSWDEAVRKLDAIKMFANPEVHDNVVVCATKMDLGKEGLLDLKVLGKAMAECAGRGIEFFRVSAKDGTNINAPFAHLAARFYAAHAKEQGLDVPQRLVALGHGRANANAEKKDCTIM